MSGNFIEFDSAVFAFALLWCNLYQLNISSIQQLITVYEFRGTYATRSFERSLECGKKHFTGFQNGDRTSWRNLFIFFKGDQSWIQKYHLTILEKWNLLFLLTGFGHWWHLGFLESVILTTIHLHSITLCMEKCCLLKRRYLV